MELGDLLRVTMLVTAVLDRLGIPYLAGGSLASSLHGIPRATQDVDLVADLGPEQVEPLVAALRGDFYVDDRMIRDAISRSSSFNVIHLATMLKVDVFVPGPEPHAVEEMRRRQRVLVNEGPTQELSVASAEDVVLHKLHWFQLGERVSERQWRDVLGVLKVQGARLDLAYLRRWATCLGVAELLDEALRAARAAGNARP